MKAELLDYMGSDLMAVNVARVSYGKWSYELNEKDIKLLGFLFKHKHISVWRHPQLQFRITCPIFVERQLFKHQIGMCLSGDSKITFKNSSGGLKFIKLKDLYDKWNNGRPHQNTEKDKKYQQKRIQNMKLRILNTDTNEFEIGKIKDIMYSGSKEVFNIICENGNSIKCSKDHKIFTKDGWKTISNGLSTKDFIGLNGLKYAGTGKYQIYNDLKKLKEDGLSINELANHYGCSYHTIRKWLKIHNLKYDKNKTLFKKGLIPWNKGKNGYKLNFSEKGYAKKIEIAKNQPKGHLSKAWRGGITSERDKIGQWTRSVAKQIHLKYNYTCQECGQGGDLHCHHIVPVTTDISKAYDINNLITLCSLCHYKVHKNAQNEIKFAEKITNINFEYLKKQFGKNTKNRKGNKLKVHFSKIVKIENIGYEDTYDIEVDNKYHNFVANGIVVHNSANSISGRYVDFSESFWKLEKLRKQSVDSKQGSSDEILDDPELLKEWYDVVQITQNTYNKMIKKGVAKEIARTILPLALNTTFIWTGSLLAFLHLFNLRLKQDVQEETRIIVASMLDQVRQLNVFKNTLEVWGY